MSETEPKQYFDSEGRECTLDVLCMREPAWAANRIRAEKARAQTAEDKAAENLRLALYRRREAEEALGRLTETEARAQTAEDALARLREVAAAVERRIVYSDTSRCWYLVADPGQPALGALREALAEAPSE